MRPRLLLTAILAAAVSVACGAAPRPSAAPHTPSASPSPSASPTQQTGDLLAGITLPSGALQNASASGNALSLDMSQQLEHTTTTGNFVDSAYSLATALAMLELGARGDTETEIAAVLHTAGVPPAQQALAWKLLDATLLARATTDGISLSVANALWLQEGLPVQPAFLDTLTTEFAAPSTPVDFQGAPQAAANLINQWASTATNGHIPVIVSPNDVAFCKFVLADAIYFDAKWQDPFVAGGTAPGPFHRADGSVVSAPLMQADLMTRPVHIGDGVTSVEMPYVGGHYVADVYMPTSQSISSFVDSLTPSSLATLEQQLQPTPDVFLEMPKFDLSTQLSLTTILSALGMPDAFDPGSADLSGIDGMRDLFIGLATQRALIHVDEIGTTAAAVTVIGGLGGASGPNDITQVVIDHPFLFVIRDITSGAIIFTAQVSDPTATS